MKPGGLAVVLLLLALVGASAVALRLTEWSSEKVVGAAEAVAKEDPYCIQVAAEGDYKEVRALDDISIFNMRANRKLSSNHHAVLAVDRLRGTELLHWSYRNQAFVPGALGPPAIYCTSRPHYLTTLKKQPHAESQMAVIRVSGMTLSIPRAFRAVAAGNSHGVSFYARAPLFEPLQIPREHGAPPSLEQTSAAVEVRFGKTGFLNRWLHKTDDSHRVVNAGLEMGLSKQLVWYLPSRKSPLDRPSVDYFVRSFEGEIETLISCDSAAGGDCMHSFYSNGWTYTFHHSKEVLGDWKSMQGRLSALAKSFLSAGMLVSVREGLFESHQVYELERTDAPSGGSR